ncbi:MAG TPA: lytic transglycosylase domain-containing protein [Thermoanaerobaculia bacterium]|nr:lytic transglycosylase domain-containing protein [Thermoanaerobaculia bacterium]
MAEPAVRMAQTLSPETAPTVQVAAAAPLPAVQATETAPAPTSPESAKAEPAEMTKPAIPEPPKPAEAEAEKAPAAATPTPAPAAPKPATLSPEEKLKKVSELLLQVNPTRRIPNSPYGELIYDIAIRHSINPHLVAALIHVESSFNPRAVSRKGAVGLMQLLPDTARRFGLKTRKDLFVPEKNLDAGIRYLKWLNKRFSGDVEKILAAYNAGEGAVARFGGIPPYRETQNYVKKIFGLLNFVIPSVTLEAPDAGGQGETALAR